MQEQNWIILKSPAFEAGTATIGRAFSCSDLLNNAFVDYHTSNDELKSIASFLVISNLETASANVELLWQQYNQLTRHCFELRDGDVLVGAFIWLQPKNQSVDALVSGMKLSQVINIAGLQDSKSNNKTKLVVNLTALGLNTREISKLLHLTTRGVDYHIEQAKRKLGANNKANLVFKANQYGWI
ncbi:helix-turn-helix transcriptional regulator [Ferrimonas lipolytica]|uniref:HTH luxR-type domain-containing protein n=1 Tax=Ferrimonas lipolytica TaxID=2724191 RepID=A0A6H1UB47_9GAMM|nr:LuxR C-terminal-related transcriptional regulator [Ferrimonas lipolytica]QIZ76281.1 hypothetical protein HER31_04860 [Ferrimonas lipolytica]